MQTLPKRVVMLQTGSEVSFFFFFFSVCFGDGAKLKGIAYYYLPWASCSKIITAGWCKICTCISIIKDSEISSCILCVCVWPSL